MRGAAFGWYRGGMKALALVLSVVAVPASALGPSGALRQLMSDAGVEALPVVQSKVCGLDSLTIRSRLDLRTDIDPNKALRDGQGAPRVKKDPNGAPTMKLSFTATSPVSGEPTVKEFTQCVQAELREQFKFEKSALKGKTVEGWSGCNRMNYTVEMKNGDILHAETCNIQFSVLGDFLEDTAAVSSVAFDAEGKKAEIVVTVEIESETLVGGFASGSPNPQTRSFIIDGREIASIR